MWLTSLYMCIFCVALHSVHVWNAANSVCVCLLLWWVVCTLFSSCTDRNCGSLADPPHLSSFFQFFALHPQLSPVSFVTFLFCLYKSLAFGCIICVCHCRAHINLQCLTNMIGQHEGQCNPANPGQTKTKLCELDFGQSQTAQKIAETYPHKNDLLMSPIIPVISWRWTARILLLVAVAQVPVCLQPGTRKPA